METLEHVSVSAAQGVHGDFRGGLAATKPERKRQVSLIETGSIAAAFAECGALGIDWSDCRRNLLVSGLRLPREEGARIAIGERLVIEVTMECDPCARMDALHEGLRAAMAPDWRGGVLGRVVEDGTIALGDEVRIL